jgi:hypothetical protein
MLFTTPLIVSTLSINRAFHGESRLIKRRHILTKQILLLAALCSLTWIAPASAQSCYSDCDCDPADRCYQGQCSIDFGPHPQCKCDNHCPYGQVCDNGLCEWPAAGCSSDCDCQPTQRCNLSNGSCEPDFGPYPQCKCDNHCSFGEVCNSGVCEEGSTPGCVQGSYCSSQAQCGAGFCSLYFHQCFC